MVYKVLFIIILLILLILALFLAWIYVSIPGHTQEELISTFPEAEPLPCDTLQILTWNIGYAGLGAGMDFFFDGGKRVKETNQVSKGNLEGILQFVAAQVDVDVFLFQEVDVYSARSYFSDQSKAIVDSKPGHYASFASNYDVRFVPVPLTKPMGRVASGLLTLSRPQQVNALRVNLPGRDKWPKKMFLPDRCLLINEYVIDSQKKLIIINIHNSAFDAGGKQRNEQIRFLRTLVLEAFEKGHFIIVGGDWNQSPAGFSPESFTNGDRGFIASPVLDDQLFPGWTLAWDPQIPSNRNLNVPYIRGETETTLIDYFLCSPNIEVLETKTLDLNFQHTDHHPVLLKVKLTN